MFIGSGTHRTTKYSSIKYLIQLTAGFNYFFQLPLSLILPQKMSQCVCHSPAKNYSVPSALLWMEPVLWILCTSKLPLIPLTLELVCKLRPVFWLSLQYQPSEFSLSHPKLITLLHVSCMCFSEGPMKSSVELPSEKCREGVRYAEVLGKFHYCGFSVPKSMTIINENVKIPLFLLKKSSLHIQFHI